MAEHSAAWTASLASDVATIEEDFEMNHLEAIEEYMTQRQEGGEDTDALSVPFTIYAALSRLGLLQPPPTAENKAPELRVLLLGAGFKEGQDGHSTSRIFSPMCALAHARGFARLTLVLVGTECVRGEGEVATAGTCFASERHASQPTVVLERAWVDGKYVNVRNKPDTALVLRTVHAFGLWHEEGADLLDLLQRLDQLYKGACCR